MSKKEKIESREAKQGEKMIEMKIASGRTALHKIEVR